MLPIILNGKKSVKIYGPLAYEDSSTLNEEYFESSSPVLAANLRFSNRKDIILKVSRDTEGEVGHHYVEWKVFDFDLTANSLTYLQSFKSSLAGDGGKMWITEIKIDDIDNEGIGEVLSIKKNRRIDGSEWLQVESEDRTTSIYKYDGEKFEVISSSETSGYVDYNGEFVYDEYVYMDTNSVVVNNLVTSQRVRLIAFEHEDYPKMMRVEFTDHRQEVVAIGRLRETYKAYDIFRLNKLFDTIIERSESNPVFRMIRKDRVPDALHMLDAFKYYGIQYMYVNVLSCLMNTNLQRSQLENVWKHSTLMFDLYEAADNIPIQKSDIHDDVVGEIQTGEQFYVLGQGQKAQIGTKRLAGNIGGAIDIGLLSKAKLISKGARD
ncbi:MAG: hypothetical protein PHV33_05135 [Elusimicrobiales bacterium]|nr:hypothetical protein [Elusimicrobiales bacterium]